MAAKRQFPQALESEEVVISGLLFYPPALFRVLDHLTDPEDFFSAPLGAIFAALLQLDQTGSVIDLVTVGQQMRQAGTLGTLKAYGGESYLLDLSCKAVTVENIGYHALQVRQAAEARRLMLAASSVVERGYLLGSEAGPATLEQYQDEAQAALFAACRQRAGVGPRPIPDIVCEAMHELHRAAASPADALPITTGYPSLDRNLAGLHQQELTLIAARPSMGKSALMGCIAVGAAKAGVPQLLFSLEMSAASLVVRLAAGEVHMDSNLLRGKPTVEALEQAKRGAGIVAELPIAIDDGGSLTLMELRARARRWRARHQGRAVIWVDYLQLIVPPPKVDSREQEISQISRGLKALAKELDVAVVALSQLNRSLEQRKDRRPLCSDLRESGSLEQDADTVLFVYRDEVYDRATKDRGVAEIIIGKQRSGPTRTVKLAYLPHCTRFEELATRRDA